MMFIEVLPCPGLTAAFEAAAITEIAPTVSPVPG